MTEATARVLKALPQKLARATRFIDAATIICEESRALSLHQCLVFLHRTSGPPVLAIDNFPDITDQHRLRHVTTREGWDYNPIFIAMRERLGPVGLKTTDPETFIPLVREYGYTGRAENAFALPVIGPRGWFATIIYGSLTPYSVELERDLAMIATHLSVWCTEHGIGPVPDLPNEQLGPRQYRVAELAALGRTNPEIAAALKISINTVKVRLKEVFDKLGVGNRTELANVLRRLAPLDDVPEGVTHLATVNVTRGPR